MKHTLDSSPFTTRRVAVVEGDPAAAEMLHTFFLLMEVDSAVVPPDDHAVDTICRLDPQLVILDLDLPNLRALEIADEVRIRIPDVAFIFATDDEDPRAPGRVIRKPRDSFEELLGVMEIVLEESPGS